MSAINVKNCLYMLQALVDSTEKNNEEDEAEKVEDGDTE